MTVTYFAYGSNMSPAVIARLSPRARYLGVGSLQDHRLAFTRRSRKTGTGVADVVRSAGDTVWGALYQIPDHDMRAIDRKEGVGWAYKKVTLPVRLRADGEEHTAVVYTVVSKEPKNIPPSREYLDGLIEAARTRGLPDAYISLMTQVINFDAVDRRDTGAPGS